jgi:hypothetical protein
MEKVFVRSERAHLDSMSAISRRLKSPQEALAVLQKTNGTSALAFAQVSHMVRHTLRKKKRSHLRSMQSPSYTSPSGVVYMGTDGARRLLNDMIFQSSSKYDTEIAKCTDYYAKQCALMTQGRGDVAAANYMAADARSHILEAQGNIERCEEDIPNKKFKLNQVKMRCENELTKMNEKLKGILEDIEVMTTILDMTECKGSFLLQDIGMMKCRDPCKNTEFISFKHQGLREKFAKLKTEVSSNVMKDVMADFFEGVRNLQTVVYVNLTNVTEFHNPPLPRTQVPVNPCTDPLQGAPSAATKRAAKCSLSPGADCYKLQERFLLIQAGISDEKDDLMESIEKWQDACHEKEAAVDAAVGNDESLLADSQTNLARATEEEANAGEKARQTAQEVDSYNDDLKKQMKTCSANYLNYESEICALKKIREEMYLIKDHGIPTFFEDCEVSRWKPEECTKKCGGGQQRITREVLTTPSQGAKCLPLTALKSCNLDPCPVDCQLEGWTGWSKCSAQCGGGVQQRLRDVRLAPRYGGKPCGETSETKACGIDACEKDCELSDWTPWSKCSKACDGGTMKRSRFVRSEPLGEGKCPDLWSNKRLEYSHCNMQGCVLDKTSAVLKCKSMLDVIILLDGSSSLGTDGWVAEINAAKTLVGALNTDVRVAVILYSGPSTWGGVKQCTMSHGGPAVDREATCKIKIVTHFTDDLTKVTTDLASLHYPHGSTLTSLALLTAKTELSLGRADAKSVVVAFTDGHPLSFKQTGIAARSLRKAARLIWVPVTKHAPLAQIKQWATRRWQENVVTVDKFDDLETPDVVTHIIADICPDVTSRQA